MQYLYSFTLHCCIDDKNNNALNSLIGTVAMSSITNDCNSSINAILKALQFVLVMHGIILHR